MKLAFAVSILLMVPAMAETQSATLAVGARVRVTSPSDDLNKHVATVTEVRGDSVVVAGRTGSRTIGLSNVTALEVSTGTRNRVMRDGLIGFGAGALLGVAFGVSAEDECSEEYICLVPASSGEFAAVGAVVFGAVGLVTGAIIGAFDRADRWERASLPVRASIGPSRSGGVSLNFSRTF